MKVTAVIIFFIILLINAQSRSFLRWVCLGGRKGGIFCWPPLTKATASCSAPLSPLCYCTEPNWGAHCECSNLGIRRLQEGNDNDVEEETCNECEDCNGCDLFNNYKYINDGSFRTYFGAQEKCREIGSDLATIRDQDELDTALFIIGDGPSPWIGLWINDENRRNERHFFTYIDGTDCPTECDGSDTGHCVCDELWYQGAPRNCSGGTRYGRVRVPEGKIDNDMPKDVELGGVLCNCVGGETERNIPAKIEDILKVDDHLDDDGYGGFKQIKDVMLFGGIILFILINNIFICYWCLCRNKKQYEAIQITEK